MAASEPKYEKFVKSFLQGGIIKGLIYREEKEYYLYNKCDLLKASNIESISHDSPFTIFVKDNQIFVENLNLTNENFDSFHFRSSHSALYDNFLRESFLSLTFNKYINLFVKLRDGRTLNLTASDLIFFGDVCCLKCSKIFRDGVASYKARFNQEYFIKGGILTKGAR